MDDPAAVSRCPGIVGDHNHRAALFPVDMADQFENRLARYRIEISGGLIGQEDRWGKDKCPGNS